MNQFKNSFDRTTPDQEVRNDLFKKICNKADQSVGTTHMQQRCMRHALKFAIVCMISVAYGAGFVYAVTKLLPASQVANESLDNKPAKSFDMNLDPVNADHVKQQDGTTNQLEEDAINDQLSHLILIDQDYTYKIWECSALDRFGFCTQESIRGYYNFYAQVDGDDIDHITYQLNQGEFLRKSEVSQDDEDTVLNGNEYILRHEKDCIISPWLSAHEGKECEYLGNPSKKLWMYSNAGSSYTVTAADQNTNENVYAIALDIPMPSYSLNKPEVIRKENLQAMVDFLKDTVIKVTVYKTSGETKVHTITFHETGMTKRSQAVLGAWD